MGFSHFSVAFVVVWATGALVVAIVLALLSPISEIDTSPDLIGVANLVWKIPFGEEGEVDFEDILNGFVPQEQASVGVATYSAEQLQKWRNANEHNNVLCRRAIDGHMPLSRTLEELWHDEGVYSACTTSAMREQGQTFSFSSLCYAQVYYLLNTQEATEKGILPDSELTGVILEAFPMASLFGNSGIQNDSLLAISQSNLSLPNKAQKICQKWASQSHVFRVQNDSEIMVPGAETEKYQDDIVLSLQDSLDQVEHLSASLSSPHSANMVVIVSASQRHEDASLWANADFDWNPSTSPQKVMYSAVTNGQVVDSLMAVLGSPNFTQENKPKAVYIIEAAENLKTVRSFMLKYLYHADLSADHWIYFFPTLAATFEERSIMKRYLTNNAWPDVHWLENLDYTNKTGSMDPANGYFPRFYGLKRGSSTKNAKSSDWVIHTKKGSMHPSEIPAQFDYRKHPKAKCLYPVISQGYCGSCWAVTMAEMISSAKCLASPEEYEYPVSIQDILSCVESDVYGCKGAFMSDALLTARNLGFTDEGCTPYYNGNCNSLAAHGTSCSTEAKEGLRLVPTAPCKGDCENGVYKSRRKIVKDIFWLNAGSGGRTSPRETAILVQEFILKNGPVIAGMAVYPDFESYDAANAVYIHKHDPTQRLLGGHAILIVGWGTDTVNGRPVDYWICKNSWSADWGDKGFFRVLRGVGGVPYIEDEIYSFSLNTEVILY